MNTDDTTPHGVAPGSSVPTRKRGPRVKRGGGRPNAYLTVAQVRCIRERLTRGDKRASIADDFRVTAETVGNIARGLAWRGVA